MFSLVAMKAKYKTKLKRSKALCLELNLFRIISVRIRKVQKRGICLNTVNFNVVLLAKRNMHSGEEYWQGKKKTVSTFVLKTTAV